MEILPHLNELTYTTSRPKSYSFQLKQAPGSKMIEPPTIHPASRQSEFYEINISRDVFNEWKEKMLKAGVNLQGTRANITALFNPVRLEQNQQVHP